MEPGFKLNFNNYSKVFVFFGSMYYNKGVDRLIKIWRDKFKDNDELLLIVAGKADRKYVELAKLKNHILDCKNILYYNEYIEDKTLHFLINKADLILMPYRHASMSEVIFTAADHKTLVLSTNAGSISEYLAGNITSFIFDNKDEAIYEKLKETVATIDGDTLAEMGLKLHSHINKNFTWDAIGQILVDDLDEKFVKKQEVLNEKLWYSKKY